MVRVLIVDDEAQLLEAFKLQLKKEGMEVTGALCAEDGLALVKRENFDVAVLDINLPDMNGVDLLLKIRQIEPTVEVIMLTGYATVDTAIRSMKTGAYDYLTKPCKISELSSIILKAYEKKSLKEKNIVLEEHLHRIGGHDDLVGGGEEIRKVKNLITIVAVSDVPVLIEGETGTGKELVARAIHDQGSRAGNPFVAINSSALQETILESELFGYKKGAFTGALSDKMGLLEIAHKGTLFVDEVGDMGLAIQAKVLRVLETGAFMKLGDTKETKVDIRFIFATNKELDIEIAEKRFRKDLFFRLNTFVITLPPLSKRKEDIGLLAGYFLEKFSRGGKKKRLSQEAIDLLIAYDWPGNVRELKNLVERSVLLSGNRAEIVAGDFPENMQNSICFEKMTVPQEEKNDTVNLATLEDDHIQRVLDSVGGNKSKAARLLGISRKKLYSRIGNKAVK